MPFTYKVHPGKTAWASNTLSFVGSTLMRLFYKIRIEAEYPLPRKGPILILSKHSTEHDIPIGYAAMRTVLGRHAWCVMKATLARSRYLSFFWKIGGIPLDRDRPEKSKDFLIYAKKVLFELDSSGLKPGDGNVLVLFPEETTFWQNMGEGQQAGFRFITGKPDRLTVVCAGFNYKKGFPRSEVLIRFGPQRNYSRDNDPAIFLHERMQEIAELSGLTYDFPPPVSRRVKQTSVTAGQ